MAEPEEKYSTQDDVDYVRRIITDLIDKQNEEPFSLGVDFQYDGERFLATVRRLANYTLTLGEDEFATELIRLKNQGPSYGTELQGNSPILKISDSLASILDRIEIELLRQSLVGRDEKELTDRPGDAMLDSEAVSGLHWASPKELDRARNVAQRGVELLERVSFYANHNKLMSVHSSIPQKVEQNEFAESVLKQILPSIKSLGEHATWIMSDEAEAFGRAVRTIERSWSGDHITPFRYCEVGHPTYPTAHQAAVDWSASYVGWIENGPFDDAEASASDVSTWLLEASERCELRDGQAEVLSLQIVKEWREALDWIGQQPSHDLSSPDATQLSSIAVSDKLKIAEVERPATPFEVWPDRGLSAAEAIARGQDPASEDHKPMRFDPRQWVVIATKQIAEDHDASGYPQFLGTEYLYADEDRQTWIAIRRRSHCELDYYEDRTFRVLAESELGDWFVDCESELPADLEPIVAPRTLTPKNLKSSVNPFPRWNGDAILVDSSVACRVSPKAKNVRPVLDAFEEEGWPDRIDDPLPGGHPTPGQRLRETVRTLNEKQEMIDFRADGTGEGIRWAWRGCTKGRQG